MTEIIPYIDWSPFFSAWELHGKYPQILDDKLVGNEAQKLLADAKVMLARFVEERIVSARAVHGFFPANSEGDDIILYTDETRTIERCRLHMLRQQWERKGQSSYRSLADYIAPLSSGRPDYLGDLPSRRDSASTNSSPSLKRTMTITVPSWPKPWPID